MTLPMSAAAQVVTLLSGDGAINIEGEIRGIEDGEYVIQTNLGPLRIEVSRVECIGEGCPDLAALAPDDGTITWRVSLWGARRAFTEHAERLAELVSEKTNGEFTIELVYGGLAPSNENLDGISQGSFEMAQFCAGYHPEKNPMPTPLPQFNILGVGSPPTSLAAFEAMTIRATGGTGDAVEALGGEPVTLPAPQVNEALTKGEINAVAFAPHAHMAFNTVENGVWWTSNLNPGTVNCPVIVNSNALAALPTSSRIALLSSVDEALEHFIDYYNESAMTAWNEALSERQIMQLTLNGDILGAISDEVAGPTAEAWITEAAALGLPVR